MITDWRRDLPKVMLTAVKITMLLIVLGIVAILLYSKFQVSSCFLQLSFPDDCEVVRPKTNNHGKGWAILFVPVGESSIDFLCRQKLYSVVVDVNNESYWRIDPTKERYMSEEVAKKEQEKLNLKPLD